VTIISVLDSVHSFRYLADENQRGSQRCIDTQRRSQRCTRTRSRERLIPSLLVSHSVRSVRVSTEPSRHQPSRFFSYRRSSHPPSQDRLCPIYLHRVCNNTSTWSTLATNRIDATPFATLLFTSKAASDSCAKVLRKLSPSKL
jgi:hypothetical protein